jgi:hypothetical protein
VKLFGSNRLLPVCTSYQSRSCRSSSLSSLYHAHAFEPACLFDIGHPVELVHALEPTHPVNPGHPVNPAHPIGLAYPVNPAHAIGPAYPLHLAYGAVRKRLHTFFYYFRPSPPRHFSSQMSDHPFENVVKQLTPPPNKLKKDLKSSFNFFVLIQINLNLIIVVDLTIENIQFV